MIDDKELLAWMNGEITPEREQVFGDWLKERGWDRRLAENLLDPVWLTNPILAGVLASVRNGRCSLLEASLVILVAMAKDRDELTNQIDRMLLGRLGTVGEPQ